MKRILVIGTSGSGKSTLARRLSDCLKLPFVATDPFYWEPGWRIASARKVRQQLLDAVNKEKWILDGNFDDEHAWLWKQADFIIWLDYSFLTTVKQILFRNIRWLITRQSIWAGNQMTWSRAISGIRHAILSYPLKRRNYPDWLAELPGIPAVQFRSPRETENWLQSLSRSSE